MATPQGVAYDAGNSRDRTVYATVRACLLHLLLEPSEDAVALPEPTEPSNNAPPAKTSSNANSSKVLVTVVAIALAIGVRAVRVWQRTEKTENTQQEQLDRSIRELQDQVNRGEAGEAVQRLFNVPAKQSSKQPQAAVTDAEAEIPAAEPEPSEQMPPSETPQP